MYYARTCGRWNVIWAHELRKTIKLERQTMPTLVLKPFNSFCISRRVTKHITLKIQCTLWKCREAIAKGEDAVVMMISANWWVDPWKQQFSNILGASTWIPFNPNLSTFGCFECLYVTALTCLVSKSTLSSCVHIIQGSQESRFWQASESSQLNVQHKNNLIP
jgi:hypothetical protein